MAKQKIMLALFEISTVMAKPWAEAGFLCYCVDTQHPSGETRDPENENIIRVGADMLDWLPPTDGEIVFAAFFPPCTDVAVSGARWFPGKGVGAAVRTLTLWKRCVDMAEMLRCPYLIENPVATISSHWRKPDHKFDPCDYGDPYTKKTCLWTGGGFAMPPKKRVKPTEGSKMHKVPPGPNRANIRSQTPPGFAQAVFEANRPNLATTRSAGWLSLYAKHPSVACAVTGAALPAILGKMHVKPWPVCTPRERKDNSNQIVLTSEMGALLDLGLISFEDDGEILVSKRLGAKERQQLALPAMLLDMRNAPAPRYLRYHRENCFVG